MRGKTHSDELRAKVIAALAMGKGIRETAREFDIDASLVSKWWKVDETRLATLATEEKPSIGELIEEHLKRSFETTNAQLEVFKETEWLRRQPAGELAILYGVLMDKQFRILAAAETARQRKQLTSELTAPEN